MRILLLAAAAFVLTQAASATEAPEATWDFHKAQTAREAGDYDKAVPIFQRFAEEGSASAQWILGGFYMNGTGVLKDLELAAMWYRKALAEMPATIPDNPPEPTEAGHDEWNLVALHLDRLRVMSPDIMAALGAMSFRGQGMPKDAVESYKWFELARHYKHPKAVIVQALVAEALSEDEIAEAEARAVAWLAGHAKFNGSVIPKDLLN